VYLENLGVRVHTDTGTIHVGRGDTDHISIAPLLHSTFNLGRYMWGGATQITYLSPSFSIQLLIWEDTRGEGRHRLHIYRLPSLLNFQFVQELTQTVRTQSRPVFNVIIRSLSRLRLCPRAGHTHTHTCISISISVSISICISNSISNSNSISIHI